MTAGAPEYMREIGRKTDDVVLAEVKKHPGLGINEIAAILGWTNGKVDGSVNRLISQRKVKVQHFSKRGMLVKKVYPIDYESKPRELFEIPKELIQENLWSKKANVYAVSRSTIGVSPAIKKEWEQKSPMKDQAETTIAEDTLRIKLPKIFADFYHLENSETSLSVIGDSIIITVEATVIPVDVPNRRTKNK